MAIKKGDLVTVNLSDLKKMTFREIQESLFSSLCRLSENDYLIVVASPYEKSFSFLTENKIPYSSILICVDLILGGTLYSGVPIKYLKRT